MSELIDELLGCDAQVICGKKPTVFRRAAAEIERLEGEIAERCEDIVRQDGIEMQRDDMSLWWSDGGRSHISEAAIRLVELGLWEEHPRMLWYRPVKSAMESSTDES